MKKIRCINLDWLECYCLEPVGIRHRDADFYREQGYFVNERQYGTRVYEQMFTINAHDSNLPFIEIRRLPVGNKSTGIHVIDERSCHIRLCNRTCYYDNAAKIMQEFIQRYDYQFQRISRVDICLDFEYFDSGDEPSKFVRRYMAGKYAKVNQSNISAHGQDTWEERRINSLSWGSKKSMITTKLYDKTKEIREVKDKPYIRQAWLICGLIDNFFTMTKGQGEYLYTPKIYRLEFSISSSVKRWFVIEDYTTGKKQLRSKHNTLDNYFTRQDMLNIFASLVDHYFKFKKYKKDLRKDRCEDKILFRFKHDIDQFYKIGRVATSIPKNKNWELLEKRLKLYLECTYNEQIKNACLTLIDDIEQNFIKNSAASPFDASEVKLLQLLIAKRINNNSAPLHEDVQAIKAMMSLENELFT